MSDYHVSVVDPVSVTNTGTVTLEFKSGYPSFELKPTKTCPLKPGQYEVIAKDYGNTVIAKIDYPDEKKFEITAEKGAEGASFVSNVDLRKKGY